MIDKYSYKFILKNWQLITEWVLVNIPKVLLLKFGCRMRLQMLAVINKNRKFSSMHVSQNMW